MPSGSPSGSSAPFDGIMVQARAEDTRVWTRPSGPIGKRKGGNETATAIGDVGVDGRGRPPPAPRVAGPPEWPNASARTTQGGREQESGSSTGEGATPGARGEPISKMRKHELIEELTERGMDSVRTRSRSCATG